MSIVVLLKKSRRYKVPISSHVFSINGTHRNIGIVGPTNLANSENNICCTNSNNVVKKSVKNTKGYLNNKLNFGTSSNQFSIDNQSINPVAKCSINNTRCFNIVKNPLWPSQNDYILYGIIAKCNSSTSDSSGNTCKFNTSGSNFIGSKRITNKCVVTKSITNVVDMDTYLRSLIYKKHCLPQSYKDISNNIIINNSCCAKC